MEEKCTKNCFISAILDQAQIIAYIMYVEWGKHTQATVLAMALQVLNITKYVWMFTEYLCTVSLESICTFIGK
jgi:hypothetical protein